MIRLPSFLLSASLVAALPFGGNLSHSNTGRSLLSDSLTAGPIAADIKTAGDFRAEIERLIVADESSFPKGTLLQGVFLKENGIVEIHADFPETYLDSLRSGEATYDEMMADVWDRFLNVRVKGFQLLALDSKSGEYISLGEFETPFVFDEAELAPDAVVGPKIEGDAKTVGQFPQLAPGGATGSLTNRVVHLNPGHGWTYRSTNAGWWGLQRPFVYNNIEDMSNADLVNQYVIAYLMNAGAEVFTVREMDPNPNMVIVDNDDGAPDYLEIGAGWSSSSLAGFKNGHIPYLRNDTASQSDNPFSFGTNRLVQCVVGAPTATATYIPAIPESGYYNVYVSHAAYNNRSPHAHYRIHHAGGYTERYIDQRRYRFTWIFLGRYYFEEGRDQSQASVVLSNSSSSATHYVSADAVRFGGGRGLINRSGIGTSGYARYDEDASYHMQFSGAPSTVHHRNVNDERSGWSARPSFANWLRGQSIAYGAPAQEHVAIANHTNAAGGTARGVISYLYTGYENTIHDRFRQAVHNQVIHNLQQGYGGNFAMNGNPLRSAAYGENNAAFPFSLGNGSFTTMPRTWHCITIPSSAG